MRVSFDVLTSHLSASAPVPQLMTSSPLLFFSTFSQLLLLILGGPGLCVPHYCLAPCVSFHFCSHHAAPLCASPPEGTWPVKQPLFSVRCAWRAALLPHAALQASDKPADGVPLSQAPIFHAVDWDHRSGVSYLSPGCRCPTAFCAGSPFSHTVHTLQCISLVTSAPENVLLTSLCLFPHL